MTSRRRSYEVGHRAKYLVVVDDTTECDRAMYYASLRAARVGVGVVLLRVIETRDRGQQWLGVANLMRAEAQEEARTMMEKFAVRSREIAGVPPERVIREGEAADQILSLIEEDEDISVLVLAAGYGKEGPGPLVSHLGAAAGTFPIPIAIVPGHLTDEELKALA